MDELLDDDYIRGRAQEIDPEQISFDVGAGTGLETHDTTHYSVLDQGGNAVSNTYTLNAGFGSGVVVEGGGFLLNDEMDDFSDLDILVVVRDDHYKKLMSERKSFAFLVN